LYYTGISRFASDVAVEQIRNTHKNIAQLNAMKQLVDKAFKILTDTDSDLDQFGHMLHETWKLKKSLSSKITTPEIDSIYETAVRNGAIGGKLLGAGGGGFLLFYCPPKQQHKLKMALSNLLYIPFKFDFNGSQIIVYQPNS
jgi:D-glycero-alpha-D-manno-heptose-7-phosphate kinase